MPVLKRLSRRLVPLKLLGFFAVAAGLAFWLGWRTVLASLENEASVSAQARVQSLESILAVQRAVAGTLSDDGLARAALLAADDPALAELVSRKLEYLREETGSTIIYLLNADGLTISASNWREEISFVGHNYAFRDYYKNATRDGTALEYALGKDSFQPGLYLTHDIRTSADDGPLLGVIVVKMQFDSMEASWARSQDLSFVTDETGRVVLASDTALRFGPAPIPGAAMHSVSETVQGTPGWQLTLYFSTKPARQIGIFTAMFVIGIGVLLVSLQRRNQRMQEARLARRAEAIRYQRDLEQAVEDRTHALKSEMEERHQAEERLARMQGELVQANKLATLGQVTAGLAHEVNQPLATIRLLADNGLALLARDPQETAQNLEQIAKMTDRIDRITQQLRGFARKATGELRAVSVKEVIEASVLLTASRRRVRGAKLIIRGDHPDLQVRAEAVRLEQVLVNLIQNAQEALSDTPDPEIRITVSSIGKEVVFEVTDNGPGISKEVEGQIFMPFVTSKSEGLGLGLVIARDIARDLGGELELRSSQPGQGATFQLRLQHA